MSRALVVIAFVVLAAGTARADESDPWAEYHRAFSLLAAGDVTEARQVLKELAARADHPAAARAARIEMLFDQVDRGPDDTGPERKTSGARAEVILFQTIHGIALGVEVCVIAECDSARANAVSLMTGAGAGLAASFFATRGGLTSGQAQAINSGVIWGAWNALGYMGAADLYGTEGARTITANLMIGQGAGLVGGALVAHYLKPTGGEVSVATTASVWATVLTMFGLGVAEVEDGQALWTTALVASDAALLAGAAIGRRHPMSRGRTLIIDAGGIVGMVAGFLIVAVTEPNTGPGMFVPLILGTGGGLAVATVMTSDWDERHKQDPAVTVGIAMTPTQGGAIAGIGGTF